MHGVHHDHSNRGLNDHYTLRFTALAVKLHDYVARLTVTVLLPSSPLEVSKEVIRPQVPLRPPCYDFSLLA